jgi:hypothetical protein
MVKIDFCPKNYFNYEKKVKAEMVNNSTNINKRNNHLSPYLTEHKKGDHEILQHPPIKTLQGRIQGGGAHPAHAPRKIGKNKIFLD